MSFVEAGIQRILLVTICLVFFCQGVYAQEATDLAGLQKQWVELEQKMIAAEEDIKSPEGDVSEKEKAFRDLVSSAESLMTQIKDAAASKLATTPNDPAALRAMLGVMLEEANKGKDAEVLRAGDMLIQQGINSAYFKVASGVDRLSTPAREIFDELILRQEEALANDLPQVRFETTKGDIVLELFENEAPNTVGNFVSLVEKGYYSDLIFHRVIEGFMAQGGGFKMDGDKEVGGKGPGYEIKCECEAVDRRPHFSGSLSMAHRGKDTGGSQFFLTFSRTSFLDGRHTCFGRVVKGHDVLDALTRTHIGREKSATGLEEPIPGVLKDKIIKAEIVRKRDHDYQPDKVSGSEKDASQD